MNFLKLTLPLAAIAILVVVLAGCDSSRVSKPDTVAPSTAVNSETNHEGMDHEGHEMHDHSAHGENHSPEEIPTAKSDMEKMMDTLASFSDEDRASAMKQHFCPVSGEMLGVMGKPEKIDVNGQAVWICCDGCKDKLLADPDKYLLKLNK